MKHLCHFNSEKMYLKVQELVQQISKITYVN